MALDQQRRIERESGKGRESAQNAGRQEQPEMLGHAGAEREIAGQQADQERAGDVDDQRAEGEAEAEQLRRRRR